MPDYIPTPWVDHFADPVTGEVYQEGTDVNAEHLNHLEQGVVAAHEHMDDTDKHLAPGERARWDAMTPQTRKVNGKPLSADISLTAADVGARPANWTPAAADTGAVPSGRKINGKPLSADVTLAAADVGARPATWNPNIADCAGMLAVAKGGTGAADAAGARKNLGITPANIGAVPTGASCNKNWNWSGQNGQPPWLWGGSEPTNMYLYNPSNFNVNYANSAGWAGSAGNADTVDGFHIAGAGTSAPGSLANNALYFVYE